MTARITKKRIVIGIAVLLAGVLGTAMTVAYAAFLRSATNTPAQACGDGRPAAPGPVVVAAGASMTQATLGADWVGSLRDRPEFGAYEFVNAGSNGNTTADLLERVDSDIVACAPDRVLLLIGTNDVRNEIPLHEFRDNLRGVLDRIHATTTARIAVMSLPPLGEDLATGINHRLEEYNDTLETVATDSGADYLALHERFAEHLSRAGGDRAAYDFSFALAYRSAAQHYLFGRSWDQVARSHGLELLVDHIHLGDRGGAIVTDMAARWLVTPGGEVGPQRVVRPG